VSICLPAIDGVAQSSRNPHSVLMEVESDYGSGHTMGRLWKASIYVQSFAVTLSDQCNRYFPAMTYHLIEFVVQSAWIQRGIKST
jgi:hypothetical protein